jgi:hypothetical protein
MQLPRLCIRKSIAARHRNENEFRILRRQADGKWKDCHRHLCDYSNDECFPYFTSVKRLIAISFILLYLFSTTDFGELLKLPLLVHHYFEHEDHHDHNNIMGL